MRAPTMKKAKKLFEDYSTHKESRIEVYAAYSLRLSRHMWRHGTEDDVWEWAEIEHIAIHGFNYENSDFVKSSQVEEEFKYAMSKLEKRFPERWWSKWMWQLREQKKRSMPNGM